MQFDHTDPPRRTCTLQADGTWGYRVRQRTVECPREHPASTDEAALYLIHPSLRESLHAWLAERGCQVDLLPADSHELPMYGVSPSDRERVEVTIG